MKRYIFLAFSIFKIVSKSTKFGFCVKTNFFIYGWFFKYLISKIWQFKRKRVLDNQKRTYCLLGSIIGAISLRIFKSCREIKVSVTTPNKIKSCSQRGRALYKGNASRLFRFTFKRSLKRWHNCAQRIQLIWNQVTLKTLIGLYECSLWSMLNNYI